MRTLPDDFVPFFSDDERMKIRVYVDVICDGIIEMATEDEVKNKKDAELREMLIDRRLKVSGTKADKIKRLLEEPPNLKQIKREKYSDVHFALVDKIEMYGNDGRGNKPVDMCRVEYWIAHLDPYNL